MTFWLALVLLGFAAVTVGIVGALASMWCSSAPWFLKLIVTGIAVVVVGSFVYHLGGDL